MKYLIVLVICVTFTSAAYNLKLNKEQKALALAYGTECAKKEGITMEQAAALRNGIFNKVDAKVKCFGNCFLEKIGFLVDGQVKADVVTKKLGPIAGADKVKSAQAECDSIKGSDNCDTAFKLFQCYHKYDANLYV